MTSVEASAALERAVRDLLDLRSMPDADAECVATAAARCRFYARAASSGAPGAQAVNDEGAAEVAAMGRGA